MAESSDTDSILESARKVLDLERAALESTARDLDSAFAEIARDICQAVGDGRKLILTGVGKNLPIAMKLTGTFNSTGVPSCLLDPNQALHGDLGLCSPGDRAILLSNSGETEDLLRVLPFLKRLDVWTIGCTANADSRLARESDSVLLYSYPREACPLDLAPTASTTAALALGDALAMVCLELRRFSREDFARFHPAGSLGKSLLLKVDDIMRTGDRFAVGTDRISIKEALFSITEARSGSIALVDANSGSLTGVFSDGDFRRAALSDPAILDLPVAPFMTSRPRAIQSGALAAEAMRIFEQFQIDDLIVVDPNQKPIGMIDGQDMPKLRLF